MRSRNATEAAVSSSLTIAQVADICGVRPDTIRGLIRAGTLQAFDMNPAGERRLWRVRADDLERFQSADNVPKPKAAKRRRRKNSNECEFFK